MKLEPDFQFNQANLQDFNDCQRRFFLRYARKLVWPAIESQPIVENEQRMQQGAVFHRMIQRFLIGIPENRLSSIDLESSLRKWWENFLTSKSNLPGLNEDEGQKFIECLLLTNLEGYRLVAKFDLLILSPDGNLLIYDWKTSRRKPKRSWLERRMQTQIYPLVAAMSTDYLSKNHLKTPPEKIKMTYWFAEDPLNPETFLYSSNLLIQGQGLVSTTIHQINEQLNVGEEAFPLTSNETKCKFCIYRSLCNRGVTAGEISETEEVGNLPEIDIDFDQIMEIEF